MATKFVLDQFICHTLEQLESARMICYLFLKLFQHISSREH